MRLLQFMVWLLLMLLLPKLVERIEETVEYAIKRGKNGVAFKEIAKYLADVEPLAAGAIAL